jgi:hypothetical protein
MKSLYDLLDYLLYFPTAFTISLTLLKYAFFKNYQYPFFLLLLMSLPLGLMGFVMILYKIVTYSGKGNILILPVFEFLLLGFFFSVSFVLAVLAFSLFKMDLIRFMVVSYCTEFIILPIISFFILHRKLSINYVALLFCSCLAYFIHDFLQFSIT